MGGRRTNLGLLVLLTCALGTGALAFALGTPSGRAVVIGHGVAGMGVLVLSPWKTALASRSVRRRPARSSMASLLLAALVVITLVSGVAHAAGVRGLPIVASAMHLHVGAALATVPLALWHVVARPQRPRSADASRRTLLRAGAVAAVAGGLWLGGEWMQRLLGLRGAARRFTGSHEQGTDDPAAMPVIQWLDDEVQHIEPARWRLAVADRRGRRLLGTDDLRADREVVRATLDCTSGWYAAQDWQGVRLDRLLEPASGARSVTVTSTTGYTRRFPIAELDRLWLVDTYADRRLSAAHGAPVRLIAPGRRGFWWVKWVTEVAVDDAPWWRQPPFPLA